MEYNARLVQIKDISQAKRELRLVGADATGVRIMTPKAVFRAVKVEGLTPKAANVLKQEMLARGGEAAVCRGSADWSVSKTDVLLLGTLGQYRTLIPKLRLQPFGLRALADQLEELLGRDQRYRGRLLCRGHVLDLGARTHIMGILNVTPDSFSDGGQYLSVNAAVERAHAMVAEGADIIDVGGESTRPGHRPISAAEELERVLPVIERLVRELPVPVSIDTYKPEVAAAALEAGVHMINDVGGLANPAMAEYAARWGAALVIMHGLTEHRRETWPDYPCVMSTLGEFFHGRLKAAETAGMPREAVVLDPGIGFGKQLDANLEIIARLGELASLGRPLLLGPSRKRLIGSVLDLPVDDRLEGTAAVVAVSIMNGANIVRVHDVRAMARVARMTDAIWCRG